MAFLQSRFLDRQSDRLVEAATRIADAFRGDGKLLLFGNGGSACQALHLSGEFVNRFVGPRRALPAIALVADTSVLTSIGNDVAFDDVFSRQIEAFGRKGDVALAITTSGGSPNVLKGLARAREQGVYTIGLLGRDGGAALDLSDLALVVEGKNTARIQEVHLLIGHVLCQLVEEMLFSAP